MYKFDPMDFETELPRSLLLEINYLYKFDPMDFETN